MEIDHEAAIEFMRVAYEPEDWIALFVKSYASGRVHTTDGRVLLEDVGGTVAGSTASGRLIERRVERPVAQ